jgi:hypothetical protein
MADEIPLRRFLVAFSFAGEHRGYVSDVDQYLCKHLRADQVFYDRRFQAELARLNLDTYLQSIYRHQSKLIVLCVSADYAKKDWPGLEWRAIRDIIKQRDAADIMPFRFDGGDLQGFFSTDGYIDARHYSPEEAGRLILERLQLTPTTPSAADTKTPPVAPSQHEALAAGYLDELIHQLEADGWIFSETFELERRVTEHATALGIATPFSRTDTSSGDEMVVWLAIADPLTGTATNRRIATFEFAPPPASPKTVKRLAYHPLNVVEREEFKRFARRLKRELARRAAVASPAMKSGSSLEEKVRRLALGSLVGVCAEAIEKYSILRPELFNELVVFGRLPGGPWRIQFKRDPLKGDSSISPRFSHHVGKISTEGDDLPFEGVGVIRTPETYAPFHDLTLLDPADKPPEAETDAEASQPRFEFLLHQLLENMKVLAKSLEEVQRLAMAEGLNVDTTPLTKLALHLPVFPYWVRTKGMTKADYDIILHDEKPLLEDALLALRRLKLELMVKAE